MHPTLDSPVPGNESKKGFTRSLLWLLPAFVLLLFMPSGQTLWIDEAQEARYALTGSIGDWWVELNADAKSQAQMPLAMLARWAWAKVAGSSEIALRSLNLLFGAGALLCFWKCGRILGVYWLPFLLAANPFFWFYMDEARPYAMTIFGAAMLGLGGVLLLAGSGKERKAAWLWVAGAAVFLCYTNILAIFTVASVGLLLLIACLRDRSLLPPKWPLCLIGLLLAVLPVAYWYLRSVLEGVGGRKAEVAGIGIANLFFTFYEFFGFLGLGIDRTGLRESMLDGGFGGALSANIPYIFPLTGLGFVWLGIIVLVIRIFPHLLLCRWWTLLASASILAAALLLFASILKGSPFWGRHLASVFPLFLLCTGWALFEISRLTKAGFWPVLLLVLLWLGSAAQIRFAERFAKDDYRGAAVFASEALERGQVVWWVADESAARYYRLFDQKDNPPQNFHLLMNQTAESMASFPTPSLVLLSKPDVYDQRKQLRAWLKDQGWKQTRSLPAFQIWAPPSPN